MDWSTAAGLLLKYGAELVDYIIKQIQKGGVVTAEDWATLMALAEQTPRSQLLAALARAGIPETDPRAVALLAALPA